MCLNAFCLSDWLQCPYWWHGMQFERILAGSISSNLLQVLHMQSSSTVWLTLLPIQIKELALLHAGVLLLCQYFATAGSVGIS